EQGEPDVAHSERSRPEQPADEHEDHEREAADELPLNALYEEQRAAPNNRRAHDPVGKSVLGQVSVGEGAEGGAEEYDAREPPSGAVDVRNRAREDDGPGERRSDGGRKLHGALGSAVARALTVSVWTPTSRR